MAADVLHVVGRHIRVKRQAEELWIEPGRPRIIGRRTTLCLAVVRMQVKGRPVYAGANAGPLKFLDNLGPPDFTALGMQPDTKEMPRMDPIGPCLREDHFVYVRKQAGVRFG